MISLERDEDYSYDPRALGSTAIRLYKYFPYDSNYDYVRGYGSRSAIDSFLNTLESIPLNEYTHVRKDNYIKVKGHIDSYYGVNYVRYVNRGKVYYAFVTKKEYANEGMTYLHIKTDVWTTFFFDITIKPSYVLREHTRPTDPSLYDEGFELGTEYLKVSSQNVFLKNNVWQLALKSTNNINRVKEGKKNDQDKVIEFVKLDTEGDIYMSDVDGSPVPCMFMYNNNYGLDDLMSKLGSSNVLLSIMKLPNAPKVGGYESKTIKFINSELNVATITVNTAKTISSTKESATITKYSDPIDEAFNYYPYSYSMLTDYINQPLILRHEYMTTNTIQGKFSYGLNPSDRWYNVGYCGDDRGLIHNITNRIYPVLPIPNDQGSQAILTSQNTLMNNQDNRSISLAMSGINTVGSVFSGQPQQFLSSVGNTYVSTMQQAKSELARINDISMQPIGLVGGTNGLEQDIFETNRVDFLTFTIRADIKKRILAFWDRWGYKCNQTKIPNINSRSQNYVEVQKLNCSGSVDDNDMREFKNIFEKGVTIVNG